MFSRGKRFARQMAKNTAKRLAKSAGKKILVLLAPVIIALWPVWLGLLAIILLLSATYSVMPQHGFLTEAQQSEQDREIQSYTEAQTHGWNVADIYIVRGEGRWYPSTSGKKVHEFKDRFGKDAQLANQWGDVYAPVLYKTMIDNEDISERFPLKEIEKVAEILHPYFYLKESKVISCGPGGCSEKTVYLLVEAYTIRGHYLYTYRWVRETYGDTYVEYEQLTDTVTIGDRWDRFDTFAGAYLDMPEGQETENARNIVFNAGEGFSAEKEWLNWLGQAFGGSYAWASGSMIPGELRPYFEEASRMYGIPVWFLAAVAMKESSFNHLALNTDYECYGLMQIMPSNWQHYASRFGFDIEADRNNPRAQIIIGTYMLYEQGLKDVDWNAPDWKEQTLPVLIYYGGYRGIDAEQRCLREYAEPIWAFAEHFDIEPGWPVAGEITDGYGWRIHPITKEEQFHPGVDIAAEHGTPVQSVSGGIAYLDYQEGGAGYYITVKDFSYAYIYMHLSGYAVEHGETVTPGQIIGYVGSTGSSTGPHLHFEVRDLKTWHHIDPLTILR